MTESSTAQIELPSSCVGSDVTVCSICDEPKPTSEFRPIHGRTTIYVCLTCWKRWMEAQEPAAGRPNQREVQKFCLKLAEKRMKEGRCMVRNAADYATQLAKLPDRIAAIVGKTYAVVGDAFQVADDQALMMIRDELDSLDESLIERNKNKRLARR